MKLHECPRCHFEHERPGLCPACARTSVLFAGMDTSLPAPKPKKAKVEPQLALLFGLK